MPIRTTPPPAMSCLMPCDFAPGLSFPYPSRRLITPHTASPAPIATTRVCKMLIADAKNAIYYVKAEFLTLFLIYLSCRNLYKKTAVCLTQQQPKNEKPSLFSFPYYIFILNCVFLQCPLSESRQAYPVSYVSVSPFLKNKNRTFKRKYGCLYINHFFIRKHPDYLLYDSLYLSVITKLRHKPYNPCVDRTA